MRPVAALLVAALSLGPPATVPAASTGAATRPTPPPPPARPYGPPLPTRGLCPRDAAWGAAARIADRMSVADQAAQTLFLAVYGSSGTGVTAAQRAANADLYGAATPADVIRTIRPGGVSLIRRNRMDPAHATVAAGNLSSVAQVRALTADLRAAAGDRGLLVALDQEGGRATLLDTGAERPPSAAAVGATGDVAHAEAVAAAIGASLRDAGVDLDWAPVADVLRAGARPDGVIGDRAYGGDPATVTPMVLAALRGLAGAGVAATAKHFPGHGYAVGDTHRYKVVLDRTLDQLFAVELPPFAAAIRAGVPAIMLSHLLVPALSLGGEPVPASRSAAVVTFLRRTLGFCGLVVTDSLWMASVRDRMTDPDVAVAALAAGADVLLTPPDARGAVAAVERAVASGRLPRQRLHDAATAVLALKVRRGLVGPPP